MTVENPGSFNSFVDAHPEIKPEEAVTIYSGALAAYKRNIAELPEGNLSPDFINLQLASNEDAMDWLAS